MNKTWFRLFSMAVILSLILSIVSTTYSAQAAGSISLIAFGTAYSQDFDTLASTGTANSTVPTGWDFYETGTNANTTYRAGTGSDNAGDTYSFGATGNAERAFGGLRSGSLVPLIGAQFTNNTGGTITSLAIAYTGEQWRLGQNTTGRAADRLDFQVSSNATSLSTGTWTDYDSLDFSSPVVAGTVGAVNGNVSPNRTAVSFTITGLSIANGASFWIRWADTDLTPGADDGLSIDDFSLTPEGEIIVVDSAPVVSASYPTNGATDVPINANMSITFSEPVNVTDPWNSLSCSSTGLHSAVVIGGPTTFTIDPSTVFVDGESCTFTVYANKITDQDSNDPPDNMQSDFVVGFTPFDVCVQPYTPIPAIQGSGLSAAITGSVTTKGVVVGDFEGTAAASGFYLQDLTGDGDQTTSDGIFVYTGNVNTVSTGQVVRVTGYARERFNQTTLNGSNSNSAVVPAANIVNCGSGSVSPVAVSLPFAELTTPERYEGMLVKFPQDLVISEYFNYDRFGEIVLGLPLEGESRLYTPTAVEEPGAPAIDRALQNSLRRITLDDANSAQNPAVLRHPNGLPFSLSNLFRGGDVVKNTIGVMGYDFSLYRIIPTDPADFTAVNPRPITPEAVGGRLRIAAMNTLNYFLTLDYPTGDPLDNKCGPLQNVECRGADSDQPDEFTRQRTKLLAALSGLDAAVIGLNEIENTPGVEPLADLVAGLGGSFAYIDTGVIGTDAIRVGLIYQPGKVTPIGSFKVLTTAVDPRFLDTKNRPTLAQTFEENETGSRFTVAVNHFKSKGSTCDDVGDPDKGDGQGNCSQTRKAAGQALVDWLATDPTGSGDADFIIMGDLNSYAMEETISVIKAGPDDTLGTADDYTNLINKYQGEFAYSYVFDGQNGYLDHALSSPGMIDQVTGVTDWHINADEPDVLDYDTTFKPTAQDALYEPNQYRTSDHDAVIVGLNLNVAPILGSITAPSTPVAVNTTVNVSANFTDADIDDTHSAQIDWGDGKVSAGVVTETNGSGSVSGEHAYTTPGLYTITMTVTDNHGASATRTFEFIVVYDPNGSFVTGGGWINSPVGAYLQDPSLTGKASFGFVAKYKKGATVPEGNTDFQFKAGDLNFKSTSYDWLVVGGTKAQFKGIGMINGEGAYQFLITAVDSTPDSFRIRITLNDQVIYDNGSQHALGGGSIVIHK